MNKKLLWIVLVLILIAASYLAVKKFHSSSPNSSSQKESKVDNSAPKEKFLDVVSITFHVGKYQEIPLPDGDASSPKVSPDGSRIVFIKMSNGKNGIAIAELPGGRVSSLDLGLEDCADPAWSPDGNKVVLAGVKNSAWEIYLYDLKEKKLVQVTNDPKRKKSWPRFSPHRFDNQFRIAYVSEQKGRKDIWWVRESGQYDQPVTVSPERMEEFRKSSYWQEVGSGTDAPAPVTKGGEAPE